MKTLEVAGELSAWLRRGQAWEWYAPKKQKTNTPPQRGEKKTRSSNDEMTAQVEFTKGDAGLLEDMNCNEYIPLEQQDSQ